MGMLIGMLVDGLIGMFVGVLIRVNFSFEKSINITSISEPILKIII